MKIAQSKYLKVLFNEGELACFGTTAYDTTPSAVSLEEGKYNSTAQYVTLNPLNGNRCDANVSAFRNILIEMDEGTLQEQKDILDRIQTPYSTLVYSGGKSYHAIIAVDDGFKDREEYDKFVRAVYHVIDPKEKLIDRTCKNPSRFTRLAEVYRSDISSMQTLVVCEYRIKKKELDNWLFNRLYYSDYLYYMAGGAKYEQVVIKQEQLLTSILNESENKKYDRWWFVSRRAKDFLSNKNGNKNYGWRNEAFYACCELARCGYDETEIYNKLYKVDGYLESDSETIPREAYQIIERLGEVGSKLDVND